MSTMTMNKELEFYTKADLVPYKGEYVAIVGDQIVAHGKQVSDVWKEARRQSPDQLPTLAKVPSDDILIIVLT